MNFAFFIEQLIQKSHMPNTALSEKHFCNTFVILSALLCRLDSILVRP